jgi:hypothetical protein
MLVGWDWASTAHDGTVIDDAGAVVDRWTPPHTEAGLSDALVRLGRSGRPEELPVAIEQSSGLFVDRLWRRPPGRSRPCQRLPRRPSVIATGWPPPWPEPCCPTPNRPIAHHHDPGDQHSGNGPRDQTAPDPDSVTAQTRALARHHRLTAIDGM